MIFSILLIILFLLVFYIASSIFWHKHFEKKCEHSKQQIVDLGYNIAIVGNKGTGKTTTSAGIVHYITEYLLFKIMKEMNDIRIKLKDIDFNLVQSVFVNSLKKHNLIDNPPTKTWYYDLAIKDTVEFVKEEYKDYLESWYSNFLNINKKLNLVEDYILYFLVINFRSSFVISTSPFYNRITHEHALLYNPSSIELRNVLNNKNFDQDFFNIIFNDEATISRGNALSSKKEVKNSGSIFFKILERNAYLGTHYTITMKQDSMNEVKDDRQLQDCNLEIFDRKDDIATFKFLRKAADFLIKIITFFVKIYCFVLSKSKKMSTNEMFEFVINNSNFYRKLEYNIYQFKEYLNSIGYIRVRLKYYLKPEDVGKEDLKKYKPYIFYFKKKYCYGVIDTNEFRTVIEKFQKNYSSNYNDEHVTTFNSHNRIKRFMDIVKGDDIDDN